MISVSILEPEDTVLKTDWCRPLRLVSMSGGMSDNYSFESMSGTPENNIRWCRVEQVLGDIWYGKSVKELNERFEPYCGGYEFIRGNIPESNQYGLTIPEMKVLYIEYLKYTVMRYGKYKEYTFDDIAHRDPRYFNWAVSQGIIQTFEEFCNASKN